MVIPLGQNTSEFQDTWCRHYRCSPRIYSGCTEPKL